MLRNALLVFALGLVVSGAALWIGGSTQVFPMIAWGAVLLLAVLFERWRYRTRTGSDLRDWQATDERFIDPESGQPMQVLYNARTGERRYEPLPSGGAPRS